MTKLEIRSEEDFAESRGLTLCDICKKKATTSCQICSHFYENRFEIDPILEKVREATANELDTNTEH